MTNHSLCLLPLALVTLTAGVARLTAADLYWDFNGAAANTGGTGNWTTANAWRLGSNTGTLQNWADGNTAFLTGTVGLVTLNANVAVTGLTNTTANNKITGSGANELDFGAGGILTSSSAATLQSLARLKGNLILVPSTGNFGTATSGYLKGDSTGLTSVIVRAPATVPQANYILDHPGAFGPAGTPVQIQSGAINLGALASESIALPTTTANGTGGNLSFNSYVTELGFVNEDLTTTGGLIRSRIGSNTWNGPVTLKANSGFILRPAAGVELIVPGNIDLGANTLTVSTDSSAAGIKLNGNISGVGGGVTAGNNGANGNGLLTLSGASTYTGPTSIAFGTLNLTGSLTSPVTIGGGAKLTGEGSTTGSLTFAGTSTLTFNAATTAALTAASVDAGTATITLALAAPAAAGTGLVIIDAPGGITGTVGTNFLFTGRGTAYLNAGNTKLLFDYTPATQIWKGNDPVNPAFWDVNTTTNWLNGASPDKFLTSDLVLFNDTAASFTVAAQGTDVQPGSVVIDNSISDYTIGGAPIAGSGSLTKQGGKTAILSANNTYTGPTTISGGTLQLGNGVDGTGSFGTAPVVNNAAITVNTGAFNSGIANNISGTGTLTQAGTGILSLLGNVTLTGDTIINPGGTLQIGNNTLFGSLSGNIVNNGTLRFFRSDATTFAGIISGTGEVVKSNASALALSGNNSYSGATTLSGNAVVTLTSPTALGTTAGITTVTTGRVELGDGLTVTGETIAISSSGVNFNGALQTVAGGTATWAGPVTLNSADARVGTGVDATLILTGPVLDGTAASLNIGSGVGGTGTVVLSTPAGSSTYTGATNMIRGTAKLGVANSLPPTTVLDLDASTAAEPCVFDLNGFNLALSGLRRGNATGGAATLTNSSATSSLITLNQEETTACSGLVTGNLGLVKNGNGQLDFTGTTSYTGETRINSGIVSFANPGLSDTATVTIGALGSANLNFSGTDRVGALIINGNTLPNGVYSSTSQGGLYAAWLGGSGALSVGLSPYDAWILGYPSLTGPDTAPDADPDKDDLANLLEFILGGDPSPNPVQDNVNPVFATQTGILTLTFRRTDDSESDTILYLEVGGDPAIWPPANRVTIGPAGNTTGTLPGGVTYTVAENGAGPDDITVTLPQIPETIKFARLKATRIP